MHNAWSPTGSEMSENSFSVFDMHNAQGAHNGLRPRDYPTTDSVADDLGVSPETIRRWIRQGRISAYRVGPRRLRIDPASLTHLVQAR